MFEGKPPVPAPAEPTGLRPLAWSELASRLAAARDLRASLEQGDGEGEASFDAESARWIAAHLEGDDDVNREDSSNAKGFGAMAADGSPKSHRGAVREA